MPGHSNTPQLQTPKATNPDGVQVVYANNLGLSATLTDVQLIFTQLSQGISSTGEVAATNPIKAMVALPLSVIPQIVNGLNTLLQNHKQMQAQLGSQTAAPKN